MKKISVSSLFAVAALLFLNSCGINQALVVNHNQNNTQVQLGSNNFKVVDKVMGTAEVPYVLCFGGMNRKQLYEKAYAAMMDKVEMKNTSRTVINVLTEEHVGGVPPFYYVRTLTVSANVIEFTR